MPDMLPIERDCARAEDGMARGLWRAMVHLKQLSTIWRWNLTRLAPTMMAGLLTLTLAVCLTRAAQADEGLTANAVYQKNCAKCHGKNATGRHFGGPALVSEKVAAASADELKSKIADGKGRMPKFAAKLKPEEIDLLVQEIQALNKK